MARDQFTEDELDRGIFRPKTEEPIQDSEPLPDTIFYTTKGKQEFFVDGLPVISEDGPNAYAKQNGTRYFVKSNGGQLADPRGLYENDLYKRVGDTNIWTWRQVNSKAFNFYVAYLNTANKSFYHNASREMF